MNEKVSKHIFELDQSRGQYSEEACDFVRKLLRKNPQRRMKSLAEVKKEPFFLNEVENFVNKALENEKQQQELIQAKQQQFPKENDTTNLLSEKDKRSIISENFWNPYVIMENYSPLQMLFDEIYSLKQKQNMNNNKFNKEIGELKRTNKMQLAMPPPPPPPPPPQTLIHSVTSPQLSNPNINNNNKNIENETNYINKPVPPVVKRRHTQQQQHVQQQLEGEQKLVSENQGFIADDSSTSTMSSKSNKSIVVDEFVDDDEDYNEFNKNNGFNQNENEDKEEEVDEDEDVEVQVFLQETTGNRTESYFTKF
jgi:hypothetical protein